MSPFLSYNLRCYYSAEIAPVGHTDSQEPQSMQESVTTYLASPSSIAPTGQEPAQAPHFTHSSEITCMVFTSNFISLRGLTPHVFFIITRISKNVNEYRLSKDIGIYCLYALYKKFIFDLKKRKEPARGAGSFQNLKIPSGEDNILNRRRNKIGVFEGYMNNLNLQLL